MIRARVVDTSVLVACANRDDARHEQARRLLAEPGAAIVPNEVVVETLGVLTHRLGRREAKKFLQALRETEGVELGHDTDLDAALQVLDQFPALSIVDACGITLAWRLGAQLDTFDHRQGAAWATFGAPGRKPSRLDAAALKKLQDEQYEAEWPLTSMDEALRT